MMRVDARSDHVNAQNLILQRMSRSERLKVGSYQAGCQTRLIKHVRLLRLVSSAVVNCLRVMLAIDGLCIIFNRARGITQTVVNGDARLAKCNDGGQNLCRVISGNNGSAIAFIMRDVGINERILLNVLRAFNAMRLSRRITFSAERRMALCDLVNESRSDARVVRVVNHVH